MENLQKTVQFASLSFATYIRTNLNVLADKNKE